MVSNMLSAKIIKYAKLSKEAVEIANKVGLSDRTVINHYKSTKNEKWKMSTDQWIKNFKNKAHF